MSRDLLVRMCRPHVVAEEIEGEVIAINLETGAYFSLRESACAIWQQFALGEALLAEIVEGALARYVGERDEVASATAAFVHALEREGLVELEDVTAGSGVVSGHGAPPAERAPFSVPVFEKYTDMQEFLLVDPIHEVDLTDWPAAADRRTP